MFTDAARTARTEGEHVTQEPYPGPQPPPAYPPVAYPPPGWGPPSYGPRENGMGTAGLVLGILGIVFSWTIVLPVLGVVFGQIGRRKARDGYADNGGTALAGFICGIVGLVLGIAIVTFYLVVILAFVNDCNGTGGC